MKKKTSNLPLCTALLGAALALAACDNDDEAPANEATANLESRSSSATTGTATFKEEGGRVKLTLSVTGATPGQHGAHIHDVGDCSAPDATSAGPHWNPSAAPHGSPTAAQHHLGDLGNIAVGQDGTGTLELSKPEWKLGDGSATDVVGKAVVIHAGQDDLVTDPAGNSGARVACGVISKQ
ncbi:MAG TPA: superoxide dismutase family protein [Myxococcus sp.]|nr:superoxide dismutase family protein [Myxococcus sp.]